MTKILFLVGLMKFWVPPSHHDVARYHSIAQDAWSVSQEEEVLEGLNRLEQAAVILAVSSFESGYSAAMDKGIKRGDGGESVCLGSIRVKHDLKLREKIAHDRKECFRRILRRVRYSWQQCWRLPFEDRMSMYIVGRCQRNDFSRRYSARMVSSFSGILEQFGGDI